MTKRIYQVGGEDNIVFFKVATVTRHHQDHELIVSRWSYESHTFVAAWGKFTHILKDVTILTILPMYGEANAVGVILEDDDGVKLKYLTSAMAVSRTSTKSICDLSDSSTRGMTTRVAN